MGMAIIFGVCFIITGVIYSRMYFTACHHTNQIQVLQIQVAQNNQIESAARKRKSAIRMFYVYLVFLVCYLPGYCVGVTRLIQSPPSTALDGVYLYSLTLVFLNSRSGFKWSFLGLEDEAHSTHYDRRTAKYLSMTKPSKL